jgi:hypothetical protein
MTQFIVLAAMKGDFLAHGGNVYENFQMMGYVESDEPLGAVKSFFDDPQFPIDWRDVRYMWAEPLKDGTDSGHYGDYGRIYIEDLTRSAREIAGADISDRGD